MILLFVISPLYFLFMDFFIEFFSKLHDLDELIRWGGYAVLALIVFAETGLLIGFFLPGDSLLVTAGLFAATGDLSIGVLFLLLATMAIVGDAVGYWIGRASGHRIFSREKSLLFAKNHLLAAKAFYEKHGGKTIILARFMPIVRTFAPVVAGVGQMPYGRFTAYNIVGGIAWVGSMLGIGYFLGRSIPDIESKIHYVIAIVIFISILPGVIEVLRHYTRAKKSV
ncbi:MAG: Protein dedA [Candidatus Parcubacteria bacterium]